MPSARNVHEIAQQANPGCPGGPQSGVRPPRYWPPGAGGRKSRPRSSAGAEWVSAPAER
jgi:hypothetical protein